MRGRDAGAEPSPSALRISSLCLVSGSDTVARSARTRRWSSGSSTTSQAPVSPISSGRVNAEWAGSATGGDDHLAHRRLAEGLQRVVGDVGAGQLVRVGGQHPRHVEGDVAVTDDHHPLVAEIDWQIGDIRDDR